MSTPYQETKERQAALNEGVRRGERFTVDGERSILAMSRRRDPFYCGQPSQLEAARWFADLFDRLFPTKRVHLRQVHYIASGAKKHPDTGERVRVRKPDGSLYENTEDDWKYLCEVSVWARNIGLVDPRRIADRRVKLLRFAPEEPPMPPGVQLEEPNLWLPRIDVDELTPLLSEGSASPTGYSYTPAHEPSLVEVWTEKNVDEEDNPLLETICREEHVNLITGVGFMTITSVYRLFDRRARLDKPVRILFLSDFDPAGSHMAVSPGRHVEFALRELSQEEKPDIRLRHLALTAAQVRELGLPPMPIKESDGRRDNFLARYGVGGATELNAIMEEEYTDYTERLIRDAIRDLRDGDLNSKLFRGRMDAKERLDEEVNRRLLGCRRSLRALERLAADIEERYRERLQALADELEAEIRPLEERAERVRRAARRRLDGLEGEIELPTVEGEEPEGAAEGWLFDSRRDYFDQLKHYKERA